MPDRYDVIGTGAGGGTPPTLSPRQASGSCCWNGQRSGHRRREPGTDGDGQGIRVGEHLIERLG